MDSLLQSKEMVTSLTVEDRSTGYYFFIIRNSHPKLIEALLQDGLGTNGGVTKPHPMMKFVNIIPSFLSYLPLTPMPIRIKISGTFDNVKVVNSPAQTFSVSNPAALVISNVNIDNCKCEEKERDQSI